MLGVGKVNLMLRLGVPEDKFCKHYIRGSYMTQQKYVDTWPSNTYALFEHPLQIHGAFHLYREVGISEFLVGNANWNTPWSQISDFESWRNLTDPDFKIQDGRSTNPQ